MKAQQNGSSIHLGVKKNKAQDNNNRKVLSSILAILFYFIFSYYVLHLLQIKSVNVITVLLSVILVLIYFMMSNKRVRNIYAVTGIVLVILLFIVQKQWFINGFFLTVNQIAEVIGIQTGKVIPQYEISLSSNQYKLAINYIWFLWLILISILSFILVFYRSLFLVWLVLLPIVLFHIFTGASSTLSNNLLLMIAILLLIINASLYRATKNRIIIGNSSLLFLFVSIVVLFFTLSFYGIFQVISSETNYTKSGFVTKIESSIKDWGEKIRYEKNPTHSYRQGDLNKLDKLELSDTVALEVIMDNPSAMYLKGFVGSKYENSRWTDLDPEVNYHAYDLFYWLEEYDLHPFNQLSKVDELTNRDNDEEVNVTVHNINANSQYIYFPYNMKTKANAIEAVKTYRDNKIDSKSLFGERFYKYTVIPDLTLNYPSLANKLYNLEKNKELEEFLKNESHYNEFVYKTYTELPDNIKLLIENHLGSLESDDRPPYEVAIHDVKTYLYENIQYNEDVEQHPDNTDFLVHLLENTKEGYAAHYATAATTMFRYLGIPSRYVEGYLITPDDIEGIEPYEKIQVSGLNAHAWTEIYIDRLGWVPIEVTPPYYDKMGQVDLSNYPEGDCGEETERPVAEGSLESSEGEGKKEVTDEEQYSQNDLKPDDQKLPLLEISLIILLIIVIVVFVIYLVYVLKNRLKLKRLKESFATKSNETIVNLFAYTMKLLHYDGIPVRKGSTYLYVGLLQEKYSTLYSEQFEKAIQINQKALYSQHEISDEEYEIVKGLMDKTLDDLINSRNFWQRIKMKYIDFIY